MLPPVAAIASLSSSQEIRTVGVIDDHKRLRGDGRVQILWVVTDIGRLKA
jgi:hypothetical protein